MDDGKGFDKELVMRDENSGMGMKNITSRLESINGSLMIHTRPGIGTLIVIEIGLENLSFQHE